MKIKLCSTQRVSILGHSWSPISIRPGYASLFCLTRPKSPSFYRYAAITAPLAIMLRFSSSGSEGIIVKSSRVTAAEYGILSKS